MGIGFLNAEISPLYSSNYSNGVDLYISISETNNQNTSDWNNRESLQDNSRFYMLRRLYDAFSPWRENRPYRTMIVNSTPDTYYTVTMHSENDLDNILQTLRDNNVNYNYDRELGDQIRDMISESAQ